MAGVAAPRRRFGVGNRTPLTRDHQLRLTLVPFWAHSSNGASRSCGILAWRSTWGASMGEGDDLGRPSQGMVGWREAPEALERDIAAG